MPIIVTTAKGGSGGTTVAAAIVLAGAHVGQTPTLIDLAGDATAAFRSVDRPDTAPTVDAWLRSSAPIERLDELADATAPPVLAWSNDPPHHRRHPNRPVVSAERWGDLLGWCVRRELRTGAPVVIDAGADGDELSAAEPAVDTTTLLVTRRCYLGVRRAARRPPPDAIVVVDEPTRAITRRDIERSIGAPVVATLAWDPTIARAIDAGLSITDAPRALRRCGAQVTAALTNAFPAAA